MTRTSFPVDARTAEMIHSGSFEAETDTSELSKKLVTGRVRHKIRDGWPP